MDGISDFSYNERDELTATDHDYQDDEAYSYDDQGNRTNDGYVTGLENRLLEDGTYSYTYDNEGNRLTRTETATGIIDEYGWDHLNRLTSITTKDSDGNVIKSAEYTYDIYGRRILKVVDSDGDGANPAETEAFVYDGEHIALVFDGEGNQTHRYLHGPQIDQVLAEETADGEVRWALTDHQGSVRDVIDNDGVLLNHIVYDSFGNITSETDAEVSFRFSYTGREFDEESGQYFYRARYYDAAIGRFINEDTIGFAGGDPNLFRYVGNSPLNYTDPLGLFEVYRGNPVVDALSTVVFPFGGPLYSPFKSQIEKIPSIDRFDVNININLGEGYAERAKDWYAERYVDPNTPDWQKPLLLAGGSLASLWDCDNSNTTVDVLSSAWGISEFASKTGSKLDDISRILQGKGKNPWLSSQGRNSSPNVQRYWSEYYSNVGEQGDDLESLINSANRRGVNVNRGVESSFDPVTKEISVSQNAKKWEFFEEFLHLKVDQGWKSNKKALLTKQLRKVKNIKGHKSVKAPARTAEEIIVKEWLLGHGDIVGVGQAEKTLLQNQIHQLSRYGTGKGY